MQPTADTNYGQLAYIPMIPEPIMELMKFILAPAMELVCFFSPVSVTSSFSTSPCEANRVNWAQLHHMIICTFSRAYLSFSNKCLFVIFDL